MVPAAALADRGGMTTAETSSQRPQPPTVKLDRDPGQLLAAVPHLMGFRPAESVVLIGHRPTEPAVLGWVLRGDLPPAEFETEQAAEMAARLSMSDAFGATIVVISGAANAAEAPEVPEVPEAGESPPHRSLVTALIESCAASELRVLHALWVAEIGTGATWQCYQDRECTGTLPDPASTTIAATMATTGRVTFDSREDLADLLTPDSPDVLARRGHALNAAIDRFDGCGCADSAEDEFESRCAVVAAALHRAKGGTLRPSDAEIVRLAMALTDTRVRDACLALALPPGSAPAIEAEALWIALVRATPEPERAEPAVLLGYSAYLRGDGALAGMALDVARKAAPDHVLAGLLHRALEHGVLPGQLERLGRADDVVDLWRADTTG